jgi:polyhydroxybutyrate depolymerase
MRRGWFLVVVAVVAACSGSSAARPAPVTTTTVAAACTPSRPAPPAGAHTFAFNGASRSYLLAIPPDYDGRAAYPLVFVFHGFASNGPASDENTSMGAKGAARGYVVVTPTSDPPEWTLFTDPTRVDDYAYVLALAADVQTQLCIDPARVFAAGHSNGSAFAGFLVCKPPYVFAAVAMVSATVPSTCPDGIAPSALAIAGTADPQVPYAGGTVGGSTIGIPAATDTVAAYVTHYHCAPDAVKDAPLAGVERARYSGCVAGADVVLDTIVSGTHPWPGSLAAIADPSDSDAGHRFDATSEILDFFDHHRRPPS